MIRGDLEYLMTSLPYLSFDDREESKKAVSSCLRKYSDSWREELPLDQLLDEEAAKYLSPQRSNLFKKITLDHLHHEEFVNSNVSVLARFSSFITQLKRELRSLRIARRTTEDPATVEKLPSPIKTGNPLEEEISILKLQWDEIEALSSLHFADFSALVAYKLKLMILLRLWSFDSDKGYEVFVENTNVLS